MSPVVAYGGVLAPELPERNGAPPPVGGQYETDDAVFVDLDLLDAETLDELVVVGEPVAALSRSSLAQKRGMAGALGR